MCPLSVDHRDFDHRVRIQLYYNWVEKGSAPTTRELADILFSTPAGIKESFARLAEQKILVLNPDDGEIWMAMPFSGVKTQHRVAAGGNSNPAGEVAQTVRTPVSEDRLANQGK